MSASTGPELAVGAVVLDSERLLGAHLVILDFEVTLLASAEPAVSGDARDARWVPLANVAELHLAPGLAEFLHDHGIITTIV